MSMGLGTSEAIGRLTIAIVALLSAASSGFALPAVAESLAPDKSIPLASVKGRLDHLSIDVPGDRLFVAALGVD